MLISNTGKYVQVSDCGKYTLVVFSKPVGDQGEAHVTYVLKDVGRIQQHGPFVFSPLEPSKGGQQDYYGNQCPKEVLDKYGPPIELIHYEEISSGLTKWEHAARYIEDGSTGQKVSFRNFPEKSPLVDGEGWNHIKSWRNPLHFLWVREMPTYNKDIKWNNFASRNGQFPFHFASWGHESLSSERTTFSPHGLVGHLLESFREGFQLTDEVLLDPTLREELRV